MNEVFIDSSYLIALVNNNDQNHDIAIELSYKLKDCTIVTSLAVLLEIGNAFSKKFHSESISILKYFYSSKNVKILPIDNDLFNQGFNIYQKYLDKEWSMVDCICFAIMKNENISQCLTFDKHFEQAGFQILLKK